MTVKYGPAYRARNGSNAATGDHEFAQHASAGSSNIDSQGSHEAIHFLTDL